MDKITVYQFTDPVCTWCWGNEPVMRAIDYLYGGKVDIEFIMGGLVENIVTLYDDKGDEADIIARANRRMARSWEAASERHGMPVDTEGFDLFTPQYKSSFPQNIAYKAALRQDPQAAKRFLRRMREAAAVERRRTSQTDVLVELAVESGLDALQFVDEFTFGGAQADFMQDRMKCRRNGITGFPSYLVTNGQTGITLGGFQNLDTFRTLIRRLSDGKLKPRKAGPSQTNALDFIKRYRSVYPVEIETVFGLDRAQTDALIEELARNGRIAMQKTGNGVRITAAETSRKRWSDAAPTAKGRAKRPAEASRTKNGPVSRGKNAAAATAKAQTTAETAATEIAPVENEVAETAACRTGITRRDGSETAATEKSSDKKRVACKA